MTFLHQSHQKIAYFATILVFFAFCITLEQQRLDYIRSIAYSLRALLIGGLLLFIQLVTLNDLGLFRGVQTAQERHRLLIGLNRLLQSYLGFDVDPLLHADDLLLLLVLPFPVARHGVHLLKG